MVSKIGVKSEEGCVSDAYGGESIKRGWMGRVTLNESGEMVRM